MRLFVGTSGFSYAEWKGTFYPQTLPDGEMLTSYAERLSTVEINNTFYRMPQPALLEGWNQKVVGDFRFALKAPRSITHIARLKETSGAEHFLKVAATLGERLGPILFQLPPFLRKDTEALRGFLAQLPSSTKAAFEFRHASWFDDEVADILRERGAALVAGDPDEGEPLPLIATAPFGYLRLRAPSYDESGLRRWYEQIAAQSWQEVYVYLKHEVLGPAYAQALQQISRGEAPVIPPPPEAKALPEKAKRPPVAKAAKTKTAKVAKATPTNAAASAPAKKAPRAKKTK